MTAPFFVDDFRALRTKQRDYNPCNACFVFEVFASASTSSCNSIESRVRPHGRPLSFGFSTQSVEIAPQRAIFLPHDVRSMTINCMKLARP